MSKLTKVDLISPQHFARSNTGVTKTLVILAKISRAILVSILQSLPLTLTAALAILKIECTH